MNPSTPHSRPFRFVSAVLVLGTATVNASGQAANTSPLLIPPKPAAVAGPAPPAVQRAALQWQTALRFHKAGKISEAVSAYKEFLKRAKDARLAPTQALPAYENLAMIYRSQAKTPELVDTLEHWSALEPANPAVHAELGSLYASSKLKQFLNAASEARRALSLKPSPTVAASAYATLGISAVASTDYAEAEKDFADSIKLEPRNAQTQYNYALALVELKRFSAARAAMQRVATLNPKTVGAWYYLGLLSESQHDYPGALKALRQAVRLAPKDAALHIEIARAHARSFDVDAAITSYLTAIELAPHNLPARLEAAQLYIQKSNYVAALPHYAEAAQLAPKNGAILAELAQCETQVAFQPQDPGPRSTLLKQAEEHYRGAAALDARLLVGQNSLAQFYDRTGAFEKAQQIYRKRIASAPNDFTAHNALAETYLMQRKPDEAITIWRRYRDAHPDDPAPTLRIASTLDAQAKWTDAIAEWRLLLNRKINSGTSAGALVAIGKDLSRAGKNKEAVEQLSAVLKLDPSGADVPKETRSAVAATIQAERVDAMQQLAEIEEHDNHFDAAIRWQHQIKAEEAATAERTHSSPSSATYLALARLHQRANMPDLAIKELDALTQTRQPRRDDFAPAYEQLGQVYESLKRFDDAAMAYRRAAQYAREPLSDRLRAAEIYQRADRLDLAIAEFAAIKKDFPKESRVLSPLALAFRQAGRDDEAIHVYDQLLLDDPKATWARDQKAIVLTHMKRYVEARALYEAELSRSPQNRQTYADIAFVFQSEGRVDAFLDWATQRLSTDPANATLMAVVVDETIRLKREESGWALLRASAEKHKSQRSVLEGTAALMAQRGRKEDALTQYRILAERFPNDTRAQVDLADALFAAGLKDDATKLYSSLIARTNIAPGDKLSIRRQYALLCIEHGDTAQAVVQLQAVVGLDPNDFDSATRLALQLEAAGRDTEAIPVLTSLATREIYPTIVRAQIRNKLGSLYLKRGDKIQAAEQYRQALALDPKDTSASDALSKIAKG